MTFSLCSHVERADPFSSRENPNFPSTTNKHHKKEMIRSTATLAPTPAPTPIQYRILQRALDHASNPKQHSASSLGSTDPPPRVFRFPAVIPNTLPQNPHPLDYDTDVCDMVPGSSPDRSRPVKKRYPKYRSRSPPTPTNTHLPDQPNILSTHFVDLLSSPPAPSTCCPPPRKRCKRSHVVEPMHSSPIKRTKSSAEGPSFRIIHSPSSDLSLDFNMPSSPPWIYLDPPLSFDSPRRKTSDLASFASAPTFICNAHTDDLKKQTPLRYTHSSPEICSSSPNPDARLVLDYPRTSQSPHHSLGLANATSSSPDLTSNYSSARHLSRLDDSEPLAPIYPHEAQSIRPQRSQGQKARSRINTLFEKYGDFVHLKNWERGAAPAVDDGDNFVSSPTPPPIDEDSFVNYPLFEDAPALSDSYMPSRPKQSILKLKHLSNIRIKRNRQEDKYIHERPSDLLNRMVVPSARHVNKNIKTESTVFLPPQLDRFLRPLPKDPHPVRVGSRSVRTSIKTSLPPTEGRSDGLLHKILQRLYGFNPRKLIRVDSDTHGAACNISAEYCRYTPNRAMFDGVTQAVRTTKPSKRSNRNSQTCTFARIPPALSRCRVMPKNTPSRLPSKSFRTIRRKDRIRPSKSHGSTTPNEKQVHGPDCPEHHLEFDLPNIRASLMSEGDSSTAPPIHIDTGLGIPGPTMFRQARVSHNGTFSCPEEWTLRQIMVRALVPPDSCVFCVITFLSGDALRYIGDVPFDYGSGAPGDGLVSFLEAHLSLGAICHTCDSQSWTKGHCLAITSFLDSGAASSRDHVVQIIRDFLDQVLGQCTELQPFAAASPAAVSLANMAAWASLWLMQLCQTCTQSSLLILCALVRSHPDPLSTPYFDAFQSLLLIELTSSICGSTSEVLSAILSTSVLSLSDQWRVILLSQELGHCLFGSFKRSFPCWDVVLKFPLCFTHGTTRHEKHNAYSFAHVLLLCHKYKWDISEAPILFVYFRDLFLEVLDSAKPLRIFDLAPSCPWELPADSPLALQYLWLVDSINNSTERNELVLQLLPTNLTCSSMINQRLLLALAIRCEIELNRVLDSFEVTTRLVSTVLSELVYYFAEGVRDMTRFRCVIDFVLGKLCSNTIFESSLLKSMIQLCIDAWEFDHVLVEEIVFAHHQVFTKLLSVHATLPTRAAALQLVHTVMRRHAQFPVFGESNNPAMVVPGKIPEFEYPMGSWDDVVDFDDNMLLADVIHAENFAMRQIAENVRPLLDAIESSILAHNVQIPIQDMNMPNHCNPFSVPISTPFHLYLAATTVAAMALKLYCPVFPEQFSSMFDYRLAYYRWPSKSIPQSIRCARTMLIAIQCLMLGCKVSDKKLTELFSVAAFAVIPESFNKIAVELIQLLLSCKECEFLSPCFEAEKPCSTLKSTLVNEIFACVSLSTRRNRPQFRTRVYRLLPQLKILFSVANDLSNVSDSNLRPIIDLVALIDLEASISGQQLPPEFQKLMVDLHDTWPSSKSLVSVLELLEQSLTPKQLKIGLASGVANFPELRLVLDLFDKLFDDGKFVELVQSMAHLANSSLTCNRVLLCNGYSDHRACLAGAVDDCPMYNPFRKLLVSHLCNRTSKARDWRMLVDVLTTISQCYEELKGGWCAAELDFLWDHLSFFMAVLQGTSYGCQMVSTSIWRICTAAACHLSFISNECVFPAAGATLAWSVPRLLFPLSILQVSRVTNFSFDHYEIDVWYSHALAFLESGACKKLMYEFPDAQPNPTSASYFSDIVRQESSCALFQRIMSFWAICYHADADIRNFLSCHVREFEWHLEKPSSCLLPLWRQYFLCPIGDVSCINTPALL